MGERDLNEDKAEFAWEDGSDDDFISKAMRAGCYTKNTARQLRCAMKACAQGHNGSAASDQAYISRKQRVVRDYDRWNGKLSEWRAKIGVKESPVGRQILQIVIPGSAHGEISLPAYLGPEALRACAKQIMSVGKLLREQADMANGETE
jgi:hypothetical protein